MSARTDCTLPEATPFALSMLDQLSECAEVVEVLAINELGALLVLIDDECPALIAHKRDASNDEVRAHKFHAICGSESEVRRRLLSIGAKLHAVN